MRTVPLHPRTRAPRALSLAVAAALCGGAAGTTAHASPLPLPARTDVAVTAPAFVTSARAVDPASGQSARSAGQQAAASAAQPAQVLPAADAMTQLPSGAECPAGTTRTKTLYSSGFEDRALPEPSYTQGWSVVSGGRTGSASARSSISASTPSSQPTQTGYWPLGLPYLTTPGGRTILRYSIKGNYPSDAAYVAVNNESGWAAPTSTWGMVTLDVTGAVTAADAGQLDIRFANFPMTPATNSTIDLDDIEVYTCTAGSRTRGDFDGDGIADLITINTAGDLQVWPGTGDLHLKSPIKGGVGWGAATWLGSPGDLNGDARADLMARFNDGRLMAYYGDGRGSFSSWKQVGNGWNGMSAIVPMADLDGDGFFDVFGRDAAGNLRRYWFKPDGTMAGGTIVGVGFHVFSSMFTTGDYDGDGRWDLTGIDGKGDMRVYTTLPTGALWGTGQRIGWGWAFRQVSSSGDATKDGRSDVLALTYDGRILGYPVLGAGKWGGTVNTGTGFGAFRLIL